MEYALVAGMLSLLLGIVLLQQHKLRQFAEREHNLIRVNRGLNLQLRDHSAALANAHDELTRLEKQVDTRQTQRPLDVKSVISNGLVATHSNQGSLFFIDVAVNTSYYSEMRKLRESGIKGLPHFFLLQDANRLVDRWALDITQTLTLQIYLYLCHQLHLDSIDPSELVLTDDTEPEAHG